MICSLSLLLLVFQNFTNRGAPCGDRLDGITLATAGSVPLIKDQPTSDENDHFEVIVNPLVPDFVVYLSKRKSTPSRNILYRYNAGTSSIEPINLQYRGVAPNIDEIVISGEYMFCISYEEKISFLITRMYQTFTLHPVDREYNYIPNPLYPGYVVKVLKNNEIPTTVHFSINFGYRYSKHIDFVEKWDWVSMDKMIIQTSHGVILLDMKNLAVKSSLEDVSHYMISKREIALPKPPHYIINTKDILLIYRPLESIEKLKIYYASLNTQIDLVFPKLLIIMDIAYFDCAFGTCYVIIIDENEEACMWSNINKHHDMVRRTCWTSPQYAEFWNSAIFISRRTEGLVYVNQDQNGHIVTHFSANHGRSFKILPISHFNLSKNAESSTFDFDIYDPLCVPANLEMVDIQTAKSTKLESFVTFDGGFTWSPIPCSSYKAISLNYDSAILSISQSSTDIIYSLDKGNSWVRYALYQSIPTILYVGRLPNKYISALIVRKGDDSRLHFKVLDFSNIFRPKCSAEHYTTQPPPTFKDACYHNMETFYKYPNPKIFCLRRFRSFSHDVVVKCACEPVNLECALNYYSSGDLCVIDKHADFVEEPIDCDRISKNPTLSSRYLNLWEDRCDPQEIDAINRMIALPAYCKLNAFTSFLLSIENGIIDVLHLQTNGAFFNSTYVYSVSIHSDIDVENPMTIDYAMRTIYIFTKGSIIVYCLENKFSPKKLYQINIKILKMALEPFSRQLIYLTDNNKLLALSLLTNFENSISDDVLSFSYSPHERIISYIKVNNQFCYCRLFETPRCAPIQSEILQFNIDMRNSKAFFLRSDHTLIIKRLDPRTHSFMPLLEIDSVADFVIHENNLYFLRDGILFRRHLVEDSRDLALPIDRKWKNLYAHRESWAGVYHICETKNCPFMCVSTIYEEATCLCPPSTFMPNDQKCTCPSENPRCLEKLCRGFFCLTGKCLHYSVKCNGVRDCDDGSDEANCLEGNHENIHRDLPPSTQNNTSYLVIGVGNGPTSDTKRSTFKYIWIGVFIFIALGILEIVIWKFLYPWCLHRYIFYRVTNAFSKYVHIKDTQPMSMQSIIPRWR